MREDGNNFLYRLSHLISVVFHPVFMPFYGLLILYNAPTLLSFAPLKIKKLSLLLVAVNNILLPLAVALVLYSRGAIKTFYARGKNERTLLLTITMFLYLVTTVMMIRLPLPNLIKAYFIATTFITFVTIIVNQFWRLSLHAVAAGGLMTVVCFLVYLFEVPVIWYLAGMIFLSGLIMFSRLYNDDHKPAEVWTGYFAGVVSMIASFLLLL